MCSKYLSYLILSIFLTCVLAEEQPLEREEVIVKAVPVTLNDLQKLFASQLAANELTDKNKTPQINVDKEANPIFPLNGYPSIPPLPFLNSYPYPQPQLYPNFYPYIRPQSYPQFNPSPFPFYPYSYPLSQFSASPYALPLAPQYNMPSPLWSSYNLPLTPSFSMNRPNKMETTAPTTTNPAQLLPLLPPWSPVNLLFAPYGMQKPMSEQSPRAAGPAVSVAEDMGVYGLEENK